MTDLLQAFALWRTRLRAAERAARAEVLALQARRLRALLEHAALRSPFYRERWRGRAPSLEEFRRLEPVGKEELLLRGFDRALTVRGFSLAAARAQIAARAPRQRGRYVVVTTSGTTGEPALFPYQRREWRESMAYLLRNADFLRRGTRSGTLAPLPLPGRGLRTAGLGTLNPIHVSTQLTASFRTGILPALTLAAGSPLEEQLRKLTEFRPVVLGGYPSALRPLAEATLRGALPIRPEAVFTGGESVTPGLRSLVQRAWGLELFDYYGTTEMVVIAGECPLHQGLHVHEDAVLLEVVDESGDAVPPGKPGAGVLLTSLIGWTLPVVRYALTDLVTLTDEPCACGLPFRRILSIQGRREETLALRAAGGGGAVSVHPFALESALEELAGVRRFRLEPDGAGGLRVLVAADPETLRRAATALRSAVAERGADPEALSVERAEAVEEPRGATDKRLRGRMRA